MTQSTEVIGDGRETASHGFNGTPTDVSGGQEFPDEPSAFDDSLELEGPRHRDLEDMPEPTADDLSDDVEDFEPIDNILRDKNLIGDSGASLKIYLNEISHTPLLDATEEVTLAKRIEKGKMAEKERRDFKGQLSPDRLKEIPGIIEDGLTAHEQFFNANLPLVVSVAKRYVGRGVPFLDLIQEGNLGLIKAVDKFDYHKGFKFSSYATWWIRQGVTRATLSQNRNVRIAEKIGNAINTMNRVNKELTNELRRQPTIEELANALEVTPQKVMDIQKAARLEYSLNMLIDDEDGSHEFGDSIEDEKQQPEADATSNLLHEDMTDSLRGLYPMELQVLELRFGLLDGMPHSVAEISRELHVRPERVKRVESIALYKLKHGPHRGLLLQYYGNEHPSDDIDEGPEV